MIEIETEKHTLYKVSCLDCKKSYYFTAEALGGLESNVNFGSYWSEFGHPHTCKKILKRYKVERVSVVVTEHGC